MTSSTPAARRPGRRPALVPGRVSPPLVILAVVAVAFCSVPLVASGTAIGPFDVFNGMKTFSSLGLVALALGLTMLIGEFDLSVLGSYALGALVAVELGRQDPVLGLAAGVLVGLLAGLVQSGLMTRLGLSSVPVTLGGLLVLLGLTYRLSEGRDVPIEDIDFGLAIDEAVGGVISLRGLVTLAVCTVVGLALSWTAVGRLVRAVGGARRASASLGLPVDRTVVAVFCASGALSALAGGMSAFALGSAQASVGFEPLSYAVTASLIGGVALSGGRGSVVGITAAAVSLSLLQGLFQLLLVQVYVSDIILGVLLLAVASLQAPGLHRAMAARAARRETAAVGG